MLCLLPPKPASTRFFPLHLLLLSSHHLTHPLLPFSTPPQDPERQGPPSRQGSALVNGINWSDRRASGALPPQSASFARSRSLPHPQDALYTDRSPSLSTYLPSECGLWGC